MTSRSAGPLPNTPSFGGHGKGATDRTVKYIADSAVKNISSDDGQTIVPTDTIDGGVTEPCGGVGILQDRSCSCHGLILADASQQQPVAPAPGFAGPT